MPTKTIPILYNIETSATPPETPDPIIILLKIIVNIPQRPPKITKASAILATRTIAARTKKL